MANKGREDKWHEEIFMGILFAFIGLMFLFKGYTKLASGFIQNGTIEGGPTKQKGIIALFAVLENGLWTYIIFGIFLLLSVGAIKRGFEKYKSKSKRA